MNEKGLSLVLGTYNRKPFLKKTIASARRELSTLDVPCEIIVVDGGSTDGTVSWLTNQKDIVSIIQHNRDTWQGKPVVQRSWGYFMNLGFKCAQGKYVCMVSDDCLIVPDALRNGYDEFERRSAEGKKLGALAFYWRDWPAFERYYVVTVKGQVYLNHGIYLRRALEDVGYINEDDYQFYCADVDLTLRIIQAGYTVEATQHALIEHCQHIATTAARQKNKDKYSQDAINFEEKWKDFLAGQRYREVGKRIESDIVPDNTTARKGFKMFYHRQRIIEALRSRITR